MKRFYLRVTAESALTIRSDHAEGGVKTTHAIPGATLLGSLASAHRTLYTENDKDFTTFFLSDNISFPQLYPAKFGEDSFQSTFTPVMPLPRTAQSCKRFPGFLFEQKEDHENEQHGVRDSLLNWGVFSLMQKNTKAAPMINTLLVPLKDHEYCGYDKGRYTGAPCNQVMDSIRGYYRRDDIDGKARMKAKADTRLQTRTGINREWGVVEESILYNREVFDDSMIFWGELILHDTLPTDEFQKLVDKFQAFVIEAGEEHVLRMGTGRTRGLGRIKVELTGAPDNYYGSFAEKLAAFNSTMHKVAQDSGVENLDPYYFAVTLQSPLILRDPFLRYQRSIDTASLSKLLGASASKYTFERVYQSVETQRISGWNELWGTPRSNDYAMEMGSTFLFACKQQPGSDLLQALHTLEVNGCGERVTEGFGRVSISDRFHLEREQV